MNQILWGVIVVGSLIIAGLAVVIGLHMYTLRKARHKTDTDTILDALDGLRSQIDYDQQHTVSEHRSLSQAIHKILGGLQFLKARSIADELAAEREREAQAKKEGGDEPDQPVA